MNSRMKVFAAEHASGLLTMLNVTRSLRLNFTSLLAAAAVEDMLWRTAWLWTHWTIEVQTVQQL